ncbi:hypothetical protein [Bacillus niameyensis]|uniref:hypothetical protein n=1 Tax=Bacillus niameyensis TaxID=1522308 RepID=UPI000B1860CE|nr:hypothetical protein [Bacillus niameyensis]
MVERAVSDGIFMHFGDIAGTSKLNPNLTTKQTNSVLISNKGRSDFPEQPYKFEFKDGF